MKENGDNEPKFVNGLEAVSFLTSKLSTQKTRPQYSFILHNIIPVNNDEILMLDLFESNVYIRFMRHTYNNVGCVTFDIIDKNTKEKIYVNTEKIFPSGQQIGGWLFEHNYISQWEIMIFNILLRLFAVGANKDFIGYIEENKMKMTKEFKYFIDYVMD